MKKSISIALVFICVILAGCSGNGSTSPKVFNQTAVKIFKSATDTLDEFDSEIIANIKSGELENIAEAADTASDDIDTLIEKMKALNTTGGEEYKESVLKCLTTVKEIIETGKKYSMLKEGYTKNEFKAIEKEYNTKRNKLSNELNKVAKEQAEFAKTVSTN